MNFSIDWDGPGEQDAKVEPNLIRDWNAVVALRIALRMLDKAYPFQTEPDAGEGQRLTKDGQDIDYVRMALDLYRNTDFPDDLGSPFTGEDDG